MPLKRIHTQLRKSVNTHMKPSDSDYMPTKKNKGTETLPFKSILSGIMKERSLTIKQVSELAEVRTSTIQNWLEGKNPHDLKSVSKLATALGISFKSLLLGEPDNALKQNFVSEFFEEQDFFDGFAKISIKRLLPRKIK